jgi:ABC-type lipoprotein export system ATPase subunit
VDTNWCHFSDDGVTVLVGQNESGKSSILDALASTFGANQITDDDLRIGEPSPTILIRLEASFDELKPQLPPDANTEQLNALQRFMAAYKGSFTVKFSWLPPDKPGAGFTTDIAIDAEELENQLTSLIPIPKPPETPTETTTVVESGVTITPVPTPKPSEIIDLDTIYDAIREIAPTFILFDQRSGLLPDRVDIGTSKAGKTQLVGAGAEAAQNYLTSASIDLEALVKSASRARENLLKRANDRVTKDFGTFWSQTIGKTERLQLECSIDNYGAEVEGKAGKPHLSFWISDGPNRLYPKQRSLGVRWFVSFYLQMRASEVTSKGSRIFLLDEPGANLHSKAQKDVLNLINQLSEGIPIVYSTHSQEMIEYAKLYRVLAVQRDDDGGDSPTKVIHAHKLGGASRDTLSPILAAMGANIANQEVIRKNNNVILEEMSAFYYLSCFWKLKKEKQEAFFIAATGASNVEILSNMFMGWGLDFVVVVDDEPTGRTVYNKLKRYMFGDDQDLATSRMLKLPNIRGIEDVFSKSDFKKNILKEQTAYEESNSEYVKRSGKLKPVLAHQLWIAVSSGKIKIADFDKETGERITQVVTSIASLLSARQLN